MSGEIRELSKYSVVDAEKMNLIEDVLKEHVKNLLCCNIEFSHADEDLADRKFDIEKELVNNYDNYSCDDIGLDDLAYEEPELKSQKDDFDKFQKYCPECGRRYPNSEHVCMDCLVHLKSFSDEIDVVDIEFHPSLTYMGNVEYSSFSELLNGDNISRIDEFRFTMADFRDILRNVKSQAFMNFDMMIKKNEIDFDSLDILDKVILFAKSFVNVDYKSSGVELGYFEGNNIFIDDRQTKSLQITTLIHELSHFLMHEILSQVICKILDVTKNSLVETLVTFILSYAPFTELIDEYSAHNVEGRFTVFGFQDYSSFLQIESSLKDEMSEDEIEITKSIGNTFAIFIKDILESLIDRDLREDIKEQFLCDVLDRPNYAALKMENCQVLNDEGFIKSLWLILADGCKIASMNIERLNSVNT